MSTYADLIRQIARQIAQFDPRDQRCLVEAVLKEAAAYRAAQEAP